MPQAGEVLAADGLSGLDLDADHGAVGMLEHHVYLYLIAVAVVEELHRLFRPGELARDLTDREVLQQRPDQGSRIFSAFLRHANEPATESGVGDDQLRRRYCALGQVR